MPNPLIALCTPPCEAQSPQPIPGVIPPSGIATTEGEVTALVASDAGTVAAGAAHVSITNTGAVDGAVLGAVLEPNQTVTFDAYYNASLNQYVMLPAISYDGTGTTLYIIRQA